MYQPIGPPQTDEDSIKVDREIVEDLLRGSQNSILTGNKNAGKTMVAMELGRCVATGEKFFGRQCRQGGVLYFAYEGGSAVAERRRAWEAGGKTTSDLFRLVDTSSWPPFIQGGDSEEFERKLHQMALALGRKMQDDRDVPGADKRSRVNLIVIDTLKAATPDSNEDVKAMDDAARLSRRLAQKYDTHVLLVQHTTKAGDTVRGHSALANDSDTVLMCTAPSNNKPRSVSIKNQRQGDTGSIGEYSLEQVDTGHTKPGFDGQPGRPERSVVLRPSRSKGLTKAARVKPEHQEMVDIVTEALRTSENEELTGDEIKGLMASWVARHAAENASERQLRTLRTKLGKVLDQHFEVIRVGNRVESVTTR